MQDSSLLLCAISATLLSSLELFLLRSSLLPAVKCDAEGNPKPDSQQHWDGKGSEFGGTGGREKVMGAVALNFCWKVGLVCHVGTMPQHVKDDGLDVEPGCPVVLAVGWGSVAARWSCAAVEVQAAVQVGWRAGLR